MKPKFLSIIVLIVLISETLAAQSWREIKTVEDICKAYPNQMQTMLNQFNLNLPGLEKVKEAQKAGNLAGACFNLLDYYKKSGNAGHLLKEQPSKTDKTNAEADTTLKNVFIVQNVRGEVLWLPNGHRDWHYKGPNNDREWAWLSNRHSQLFQVYQAYLETGNPKYAEYIDEFIRDFIIAGWPYPAEKSSTSVWRGLEVSFRAKVWPAIFYGMLNSDYLSPATRLLILSSLPGHAHYNRNFHGGNNWLTMEISALATVATNFPEYKNSPEWLEYSVKTMTESMKGQVYPDGVQTELTSHYHNVSLHNFVLFKEICDRANYPLPEFFNKTIEQMYSYIAHAVRPDGNRILNNDGDRGSDVNLILEGAEKYRQPEWEYIATNGKSGVKPADGPSYFYPWAGQLISRSGFDNDAHWSFFDVGPWGSGHQHNDKMHISVAAFGRDLLVDAGRFAYTGAVAEKFRPYASGTQGHNSVLFDGKGQQADILVTDKPLSEKHWKITPEFDYAWNSFDKYIDIEGKVKHTRTLLYVRDNFWVIADSIKTDRPRKIDVLWHWHPDCSVHIAGDKTVSTQNERGNLKIIPASNLKWKVKNVKGAEDPELQGWYSEEYNKFEPNFVTIYSTTIEKDAVFFWTLIPYEKEIDEFVAVPISIGSMSVAFAVVQKNKGNWELTIPFSDSSQAKVEFAK